MAREDESWFELLANIPWWVCVIFSGIVFVLMRFVIPSLHLYHNDQLGTAMFQGIAHGVYVLAPFVSIVLLIPIPFGLFYKWARKRGYKI